MADTVAILREQTEALMKTQEMTEIIQSTIESSIALKAMTRLPNMASGVMEYAIMDSYPMAGFVDGDTGLKMTTNMSWKNKKLYVGEIAAIVPIPDNIVADSNYDIWGQVKPRLIEAAGRVIDKAIFFGIDKPNNWRDGILQGATAAGNVVTETADIYDDIFGIDGAISKIEEDGYFPDQIISAINMRAKLRALRDTTNRPLYLEDMKSMTPYTLNGMSMQFPRNGAFDATKANLFVGDFKQAVYAIRQDITFDVFNSGVISDADGKVIFNLMQNDMKAIRMVIRLGWDIFNPLNAINPDEATRFPFAVYLPANTAKARQMPEQEQMLNPSENGKFLNNDFFDNDVADDKVSDNDVADDKVSDNDVADDEFLNKNKNSRKK